MVFSQTSVPTRNILKVVELNNLKQEPAKNTTETLTGGISEQYQPMAMDNPNYSEVYLKPEPLFEDTMLSESDREFFQDLVQWCSDPAKEESIATDAIMKPEEITNNTDTLHTISSPPTWDILDGNSLTQVGYHTFASRGLLSPKFEEFNHLDPKFLFDSKAEQERIEALEPNLDILNLPVVFGDLSSENMVDLNPRPIVAIDNYSTNTTQNTEYCQTFDTQQILLHNNDDEEDSLDMKLGSAIPGEVENTNGMAFNTNQRRSDVSLKTCPDRRGAHLTLDVTTPTPAPWFDGPISTPEVLSYVEQLEKEKLPIMNTLQVWPASDTDIICPQHSPDSTVAHPIDFEPVTPKSESHVDSDAESTKIHKKRKRFESKDSDETYTPHNDYTPRKYKKRKPNVPIKDMILALEESQQLPKARRGRPPKRRESTVSSVCSLDDNTSSASSHEVKYRELRDKNNEASKRSRMNRKLKELQMEQLAIDLEERNKKLKVKADILEDMTKRLKDALMTAILHK